jgi:PAS domain S-box-containing protein
VTSGFTGEIKEQTIFTMNHLSAVSGADSLFYNMPLGVVYQNAVGEIVAANREAEKILGLSLDQMQGKKSIDPNWRSVREDGSDFPGEEHPAMQALKTGKRIDNVKMGVYRPASQSQVWINIHAIPEFRPGEKEPFQVFTTFSDITDQVIAQRTLLESEIKYRSLVNGIQVPIMIIQDGIIRYANSTLIETSGFAEKELLGRHFKDFVHPEDWPTVLLYNQMRLTDQLADTRYQIRAMHKDGSFLYIQVHSQMVNFNEGEALLVAMHNVHDQVTSRMELEKSKHEYKALLENSGAAILVINREGKYEMVNSLAAKNLGRKPEEIIGKTLYDVLDHAVADEYYAKNLQAIDNGSDKIYEREFDLPIGKRIFLVNDVVLRDQSGQGRAIQSSSLDISELRQTQIKLETLLDHTEEIIYAFDRDYNLFIRNKAFNLLFQGLFADQAEKVTINNLKEVIGESFEELRERFEAALEGNRQSFQYSLEMPDGLRVFINSFNPIFSKKGEVTGVIVISRDITARWRVEKDLADQERRTNEIVRNAELGTWEWNVQSGETVFNERWAEIVGYKLDELAPVSIQTWLDLAHPDDLENSEEALSRHFSGEADHYCCESRMRHKNGNWIWVKDTGKVNSWTDDCKPLIMSGTHQDITAEKEAHQKVKQRLEFEETMAAIAIRFVKYESLNSTILDAFADMARLSGASRVYLFEYNHQNQTMSNTLEWCQQDVEAEIDNLQNLPMSIFPWWTQQMILNKLIKISDVNAMPDDQLAEREILKAQNITSLLAVPIFVRGESFGFIGFDNVSEQKGWSEEDESLLTLFTTILSNAIEAKEDRDLIEASERGFRSLFENHVAIKLLINPSDGSIVDANFAAVNFYGWSRDELREKRISDLNIGAPIEVSESLEMASRGESTTFEFQHQLKNGAIRDVEVFTGLVFYRDQHLLYSIIIDVTEEKSNIRKLEVLGQAVAQSPVSTIITNKSAEVVYVNDAFKKITGYNSLDVIGKSTKFLNSGTYSPDFYDNLWNTISSGKNWVAEMKNRRKDGTQFFAKQVITPILNKERSEIVNYVSLIEDITEQKNTLDSLILAKMKAEESDRLKSAFLATMSHELRTPLNHIIGFSSLLPEMTTDKNVIDFANMIHQSGSHLLNIIEDIFSLAMLEQSTVVTREMQFPIRDLVMEIQKLAQEMMGASGKTDQIKLNFDLSGVEMGQVVVSDKPKIVQVMTNLIKNAFKFTHQGEIAIGIEWQDREHLGLIVSDTGIGIAREKQELIFEFFRQADDSHTRLYGGIGIGLALASKIADAMNGSIHVSSELNEGSTFRFVIPVKAVNAADMPKQSDVAVNLPDLTGKIVLIVEDDLLTMDMMVVILTRLKCEIVKAENGRIAVEMIKSKQPVDLILMDLKMPQMNGFDATKAIREFNQEIPIIALSALTFEHDKSKAIEAGCTDILCKPVQNAILYRKMEGLLLGSLSEEDGFQ